MTQTTRTVTVTVVDDAPAATIAFPHSIELLTASSTGRHYCRAYLDDGSTLLSPMFNTIEEVRAFASVTLVEGLILPD